MHRWHHNLQPWLERIVLAGMDRSIARTLSHVICQCWNLRGRSMMKPPAPIHPFQLRSHPRSQPRYTPTSPLEHHPCNMSTRLEHHPYNTLHYPKCIHQPHPAQHHLLPMTLPATSNPDHPTSMDLLPMLHVHHQLDVATHPIQPPVNHNPLVTLVMIPHVKRVGSMVTRPIDAIC